MTANINQLSISPLVSNNTYNQLFSDKLSLHYALTNYQQYLMQYCAVVVKRDNEKVFAFVSEHKEQTIVSFLDSGKSLNIIKSKNSDDSLCEIKSLKKEADNYYLDDKKIAIDNLIDFLEEDDVIITDNIKNKQLLQIATIKDKNFKSYLVGNANVNESIQSTILMITDDFPQITCLNFYIVLDDNGNDFTIYKITTDINVDLQSKVVDKQQASFKKFLKKQMDTFLQKKGWQGYMYRHWLKGLIDDWRYNGTTIKQKIWANTKGFYSYRIEQYGLTNDNYKEFLSDKEYKWLRNINNAYRKLLRDKIQFYYNLQEYKQYLPEYYFHLVYHLSEIQVIDLNTPTKKSNFDEILELLKLKKKLAIKPVSASSGRGFLKLEYKDNSFLKNNITVSSQEIIQCLAELEEDHIVSEYVEMHQEIKKYYADATSTIRIMVINKTANNPKIVAAYMRLGNKKSGQVDNIGRGGISLLLDHNNGDILNAERLINHKFIPIAYHPDTNEIIQGSVPNWSFICKEIEKICYSINPIEYLGLDIVVTDGGFKILEINLHQELHKYPCYSQEVKEYFNNKLRLKISK